MLSQLLERAELSNGNREFKKTIEKIAKTFEKDQEISIFLPIIRALMPADQLLFNHIFAEGYFMLRPNDLYCILNTTL